MVEFATGGRGGAGQPAVAVVQAGAVVRVSVTLLLHRREAQVTFRGRMGRQHFNTWPASVRTPTKVLMRSVVASTRPVTPNPTRGPGDLHPGN